MGSASQGVGQLLRETREKLGHSLPAVATALRIRQPYLQAIEAGRYQDLPGSAYAVGFVRSYADYLGLDGNEIVRRFKQESGNDFSSRAELSFPSAVSEGSFPTGGMLFIGLVVAVIAYGVWYWSNRESSVAESVPPLPDRLAALIHKPVGSGAEVVPTTQTPANPAAPSAMSSSAMSSSATSPNATSPSATVPSTAASSAASATPASAPAAAEPPAAAREDVVPPNEGEAAAPAPAAASAVEAKPDEKADAKKARKPDTAAPAVAPVSAAAPAATSASLETPSAAASQSATEALNKASAAAAAQANGVQATAAQAAASAKPSSGKIDQPVALPPDAARVILKANDDCWIRIRDASGAIIHSGILRKGTSFRVTPHPGQTLTAGNAAALTVLVDNRPIGPLGGEGKVRKDVPLDPEHLDKLAPASDAAPAADTPAASGGAAPAASGAAKPQGE